MNSLAFPLLYIKLLINAEGNSQKLKHRGNRSGKGQDAKAVGEANGVNLLRVLRAGKKAYFRSKTVVRRSAGLKRAGRLGRRRLVIKALLSTREKEVLGWLNRGKTSWDISRILNISERTVNYHVGNIMRKLGVNSRLHAVSESTGRDLHESS
ncbi:MAG: helix-turn-helix transcriptional regulator [Thermodesulfovibrionales bacterium]